MITWRRPGKAMAVNEPPRWQRPSPDYPLQTQTGQRALVTSIVVGSLVILIIGMGLLTAVHHPGGVFFM